ncbi:MAG: bifunctional ornithine acetyltransferase/N-acetylglutamate synthase, partial [Chloroflexota bacterium]
MDWKQIAHGGVTSPRGFKAGATAAGIKVKNGLDLALLYSEAPCQTAGLFTANRIKAAPVLVSRRYLRRGQVQAVVANSGCANAMTGKQGLKDAEEMAACAAQKLGLSPRQALVASTGVIGQFLPMEKVVRGLARISLSAEKGGEELARAIMTTDTFPKEIAVEAGGFRLGGAAKGAGMIHPNLATMLAFLTTDARVEVGFLKKCLRQAALWDEVKDRLG